MSTDSKEQYVPIPLPTSIYEAFREEGYDPLTLIMLDESGEEKTFVRPGIKLTGPHPFDVSDLESPHLTVQSASGWCLICNRWGCYWVPCVL